MKIHFYSRLFLIFAKRTSIFEELPFLNSFQIKNPDIPRARRGVAGHGWSGQRGGAESGAGRGEVGWGGAEWKRTGHDPSFSASIIPKRNVLNVLSEIQRTKPSINRSNEQDVSLMRDSRVVDNWCISRTMAAVRSWLLDSSPTPFGLCKRYVFQVRHIQIEYPLPSSIRSQRWKKLIIGNIRRWKKK